ncbi:uncharacterized protein BcabD6B2_17800 [Babesia caballi]|uniref:Uncharacterized protein n=1 Tax=Babesia caballi TaxID=5871 RepID=A0AAV4LRB6_BABCB|nr:hypothetical protein, conserved [Babesia caballi]
MWHVGRKESIAGGDGRASVMDTLLLRPAKEDMELENVNSARSSVESGAATPFAVSDGTPSGLDTSRVTPVRSPTLSRERRTPLTRSQQLAILLARNHYSAPACSLDFVNLTPCLSELCESRRDSLGSLVENSEERAPREEAVSPQAPQGDASPPKPDDTTAGGKETASLSRAETGSTNVESDFVEDDGREEAPAVERGEAATCALIAMHRASAALGPAPTAGVRTAELSLGRLVHRNCVDMATSPLTSALDVPTLSTAAASGVEAGTSPMASAKKSIPVYSRSLLYRIRVPLAQRLRNCSSYGDANQSPQGSARRVNMSCYRRSASLRLSSQRASAVEFSMSELNTDSPPTAASSDGVSDGSAGRGPSPGCDATFRKRARQAALEDERRRRLARSSPGRGLVVAGELWLSGTMKNIGPKIEGSAGSGRRDSHASMLRRLLKRQRSLSSSLSSC